jgi:hypothetical protein
MKRNMNKRPLDSFIGIAALVAVISLGLAGCNGSGGGSGGGGTSPTTSYTYTSGIYVMTITKTNAGQNSLAMKSIYPGFDYENLNGCWARLYLSAHCPMVRFSVSNTTPAFTILRLSAV